MLNLKDVDWLILKNKIILYKWLKCNCFLRMIKIKKKIFLLYFYILKLLIDIKFIIMVI